MEVTLTDSNPLQRIKLNVGGVLFESSRGTLEKSPFFIMYLCEQFIDKQTQTYIINRSGEKFQYVLALLRNTDYPYPVEYLDELKSYHMGPPKNITYGLKEHKMGEYDRKININHLISKYYKMFSEKGLYKKDNEYYYIRYTCMYTDIIYTVYSIIDDIEYYKGDDISDYKKVDRNELIKRIKEIDYLK